MVASAPFSDHNIRAHTVACVSAVQIAHLMRREVVHRAGQHHSGIGETVTACQCCSAAYSWPSGIYKRKKVTILFFDKVHRKFLSSVADRQLYEASAVGACQNYRGTPVE